MAGTWIGPAVAAGAGAAATLLRRARVRVHVQIRLTKGRQTDDSGVCAGAAIAFRLHVRSSARGNRSSTGVTVRVGERVCDELVRQHTPTHVYATRWVRAMQLVLVLARPRNAAVRFAKAGAPPRRHTLEMAVVPSSSDPTACTRVGTGYWAAGEAAGVAVAEHVARSAVLDLPWPIA